MERKEILKRMAQVVFFIFILNTVAKLLYWYTSVWWFDMPMHFLGGFFLGFFVVYVFSLKDVYKIFLYILIIGIGWEVFELIFNNIIAGQPFIVLDTFSDICFDLSGGLSAILYLCQKN
jgi:hypothetical protein